MAEELDGNTILARSLKEQVTIFHPTIGQLSILMPFYL